MLPLYLENITLSEFRQRVEALYQLMTECRICPNECLVSRAKGETGECHSTDEVVISNFGAHFGEEPPLVGSNGSGTIFFTNCNLKCHFCQNYDISHLNVGKKISIAELAEVMLRLQQNGCHNINLVTPTHFTPQIVDALATAAERGLELPIVYNSGGYESIETLTLLDGIIDIYMPDIKYSVNEYAFRYSGVKHYWETVKLAVKEMHRQVGDLKISDSGIAQRGLLLRHLILPNDIAGSERVLRFIASEISTDTYLNLMDQYRPAGNAGKYPELNRHLSPEEYSKIINYARQLGLKIPEMN